MKNIYLIIGFIIVAGSTFFSSGNMLLSAAFMLAGLCYCFFIFMNRKKSIRTNMKTAAERF